MSGDQILYGPLGLVREANSRAYILDSLPLSCLYPLAFSLYPLVFSLYPLAFSLYPLALSLYPLAFINLYPLAFSIFPDILARPRLQ